MALKFPNRARMTTATTGTGTLTLGVAVGSPSRGYFQSFADAGVADGDTVRYVIEDGANWEIGTGTYTASGTTLTRSVIESTNADAAINLSGGAEIYASVIGADLLFARREVLTSNRTYHVRTDGSDSNDGLTNNSGGAFLTIQKAVNVVASLDISVFNVTISVAAGTYSGSILALISAPWIGSGLVTIAGTGSCTLSSSARAVEVIGVGARIVLSGLTIVSTNLGIQSQNGGLIELGAGMVFGACTAGHMRANGPGSKIVTANSTYTITGGGAHHFSSSPGGFIDGTSSIVTITGTPAFSNAFSVGDRLGLSTFLAASFTGAATGKRYSATSNAVINSAGGGATFFPGDAAGTTASGGLYL